MLVTVTPLRLTFGGGGSDLVNGHGVCLSATIDKHITISVSDSWTNRYVLHYSQFEDVAHAEDIQHRIIRRAFLEFGIQPGVQVSSLADVPAGTGLGSSGAFTVGLIKALMPVASRLSVAQWACDLDIGQQDQWSAAFGGWNVYDFAAGTVRPIHTSLTGADFALYYTGMRHDAAQILTGPAKSRDQAEDEIGRMVPALEANDLESVGRLFSRQWAEKHSRCPSREHRIIDAWIEAGIKAGAHGGKLIGAGNGGFILFAGAPDLDLKRVPFGFTEQGVRCA